MRINRYLARAGIASRRGAEELVTSGQVSLNGQTITNLATEVNTTKDIVKLNGNLVSLPDHVYYLLNKPRGYTCTHRDPHATKTIFELLPPIEGLISVGRLDKETTGLILLTNDGLFAQNIIHPSKKIPKIYQITLRKPLTSAAAGQLLKGVQLDDGLATATKIKTISPPEIALTIEEGRKRIVRRMIDAIGNEVKALKRTQLGEILLDIPEGQYRPLTKGEIEPYV